MPAATATNGTPSRLAASIHATASGVLGMYLHGKDALVGENWTDSVCRCMGSAVQRGLTAFGTAAF